MERLEYVYISKHLSLVQFSSTQIFYWKLYLTVNFCKRQLTQITTKCEVKLQMQKIVTSVTCNMRSPQVILLSIISYECPVHTRTHCFKISIHAHTSLYLLWLRLDIKSLLCNGGPVLSIWKLFLNCLVTCKSMFDKYYCMIMKYKEYKIIQTILYRKTSLGEERWSSHPSSSNLF